MASSFSEMTDFEINCAVAASLGREFFYNSPGEPGKRRKSFVIDDVCRDVYESGAWSSDVFDPCKSWADAGPIIEKENISLTCHQSRDEWAAIFNRHCMAANNNPLRAAMECFLMKKERENAA
ncbi:phage protein NinX family protein [Pantoea agglomerans]|uniref:phage protein NinX family protein n=1 Tax=Enterobacter agglomerans TaxID=549 RepID=UPI0013BB2937|nr:phage protein NinX family protein [Pantoea agglomerans]NEG57989.1 DUF2591 domain-containing protein [Pantoea agglomerans]NEG99703.1 DUF2591 domain-containing protein [Pantoea agglomerans]NEH04335.1 DUF2591 domain-containing protein [Pantoea agglomerans]NEH14262.1 DUF2591 domain-containing protein [Pantoea agglomerans]